MVYLLLFYSNTKSEACVRENFEFFKVLLSFSRLLSILKHKTELACSINDYDYDYYSSPATFKWTKSEGTMEELLMMPGLKTPMKSDKQSFPASADTDAQ